MDKLADANAKSAIETARLLGATTPREAAEIIAGRRLSNREWEQYKGDWERNWSHIGSRHQPPRIEHTFAVARQSGIPRVGMDVVRKAFDFFQKRSERRRWWRDYKIKDKHFRKEHHWDDSRGEWVRNDGQPIDDDAWSPLGALLDRIEKKGRLDEISPGLL
jgi:hypothetical protein